MTLLDRLRRFVTGTEDARVIRIEQAIADARMNWLEALLLEIAMGIAAARRFTPMHVENPSGEYVQAKIAATLAALQVAKSSLVLAFAGEVNAAELLGGMDALLGALDRLEVLIHCGGHCPHGEARELEEWIASQRQELAVLNQRISKGAA